MRLVRMNSNTKRVLISFSIILSIIGVMFIWKGYRDVDFSFNMTYYNYMLMKYLNSNGISVSLEVYDSNPFTKTEISMVDLYDLGIKEIMIGYVLLSSSIIILSWLLIREVKLR